ncbi:uncharacterized protein LOC130445841 [Diorhabda sublineata]|uniref:uncharacterized protein LOC130445841 n=1 Tax=Diorhabda sublineata TaxID=1163346 RepID=UPI0024E09919|nr:uncharacterized protein LOC130445841 [Diorhabda sublineata]
MSLENLKTQRRSVKSSITRMNNWITSQSTVTNETAFMNECINRRDKLEKYFLQYENIQGQIEMLIENSQDELSDNEDIDLVEKKYFTTNSELSRMINELTSNDNSNSQSQTNNNCNIDVKLPDISLPKFKGQTSEWPSFIQLFENLIISNNSLKNIKKLLYLKASLSNEPLQLIDDLELCDDNFQIAIDTLKQRYDDQSVLLYNFIDQIYQQKPVSKTGPTFLHKKLDLPTRKLFEQSKKQGEIPSLENFFDFLKQRSGILERTQNIQASTSNSNDTKQKFSPKYSKTTAHVNSMIPTNSQSDCYYCKNASHCIYTCESFENLSISDKYKFIHSNNLCKNCLGGRHITRDCKSLKSCSICQKRHHTYLHSDSFRANDDAHNNNNGSISQNRCNNSQSIHSNVHTTNGQHPHTKSINNRNNNFNRQIDENSHPHQATDNRQNPSRPQKNYDNAETNENSQDNNSNVSAIQTQSLSALSTECHVLLATAKIIMNDSHNNPFKTTILLDNGSQNSFVSQELVNKLQLKTFEKTLQISGISQTVSTTNKMVHLKFFPHSNPIKHFEIPCAVLPKITCKLPQVKINVSQLRLPTDIILANPEFNIPSEIHILVGADLYYKLLTPGIIDLGKKLPSLQNTSLGWMIAGTIPNSASFNSVNIQNNDSVFTSCNHISISKKDLSSSLSKFWEQEEIPSKSILSFDDELAETIFQNSTQILENGRFQVNFPLKSEKEHHKLGESFLIAKRRFLSLENRIHKNPELFSEYVNLGHAKYVTLNLTNSKNELKYFIPHLCVIREQSISTKLRIVFDSSCPTSTGVSLNDITLKGYQVQPDLFDILCRFRLNKFTITSDVQKMFRQISINTEHRFLQNILWRENPQQPLQCIELSTLTYGCNFSPFVATRVLQEIANNNSSNFSLAANALISETYMDDIISGTNSEHELIKLIQELKIVLGNHGFNLHKWASNNSNVLAEISDSNNSSFLQNPEKCISLDLENSQNKVLGLNWIPASDNLNISVPTTFSIFPATKRKILSTISRCFDPLGLYNPIILSGKLLVKQLWQAKLDWDTEISDPVILEKWHTFVNNLPKLSQLTIPRFIFLDKSINLIEMHGFSDASLKAFGVCVYLRTIYSDNSVSCNLISAKSRVCPVSTTITLPRLELSAMLLLSNLVDKIYKNFQTKINIISVNLWSDSQIALCCRNGEPSRWTVFVGNRVAKIQAITKDHSWRYVNTIDNPADLVSRGTSANNLISN